MTDGAATDCRVYYCPVCGPCLQQIVPTQGNEDGTITIHADKPHPYDLTFDEEERPQ